MATIKLTPIQKEMLQSAQCNRIWAVRYNLVSTSLVEAGLLFRSFYDGEWSEYAITPAGLAYLYQDAPMVDQPQPAPEVNNDDLPFSDVGKDSPVLFDGLHVNELSNDKLLSLANSETIHLWIIEAEITRRGLSHKPTLSNIIDAALDPDNQAAYEALKAYDFASTPLWALEIERDDVNAYKWQIWHELRKIPHGVMGSNPDYAAKQLEVDRAFNVTSILNDAMYRHYTGKGFNVLD